MCKRVFFLRSAIAAAVAAAGLLAGPATAAAQTVVGSARAVKATTFGLLGATTTVLASTDPLAGAGDAQDATLVTGSIPSLLTSEVLNAVTIGWPDQVVSEASLASLGLTVGGIPISADFALARVESALDSGVSATVQLDNLSINGVPIAVSGAPNQTVSIPGGRVVINEQVVSPVGTTVNALHAVVDGVADVVVASATAGVQ